MKTNILLCAIMARCLLAASAAQLSESTFTEIIKEVAVLPDLTRTSAPAKLNQLVKAPDLVRTGADSRAELTAPDNTITRVGANTVFSFEAKDRVLNLQKGSLLFHAPKGVGGGMIKSGGASAAVLGTTLLVAATAEGGFKVILLEGRGRVTLPNGRSVGLRAGQIVYVLPGGNRFSGVLDVNLAKLVAGSLLLTGFSHELPSARLIQDAVQRQSDQLAKGRVEDTGVSADNFARKPRVGNGLGALDDNAYATFVLPEISRQKPGNTSAP
jgi:hypothetical protein